jgi:four helix bundle protein
MFIIIWYFKRLRFQRSDYKGCCFSINNIAEGFERNSDKEFITFLDIARSSCSEVKSMIYLANRLKFIDDTIRENLIAKAEEVSKIIYGLIKSLQK